MKTRRAVLLIGSAKASGTSTSEALGKYLRARLNERGVAMTVVPVSRSGQRKDDDLLAAAVADTDLFVLATPVYVDSLPYLVTRALEELSANRRSAMPARSGLFAALVNCGLPEAHHCRTALDIARAFARRAGLVWAGGLAIGEGGAIDGRPLDELGTMAKRLRAALDLAAGALAEGAPIPEEAVRLAARPMMPHLMYTMLGNAAWRRQARRHGVTGGQQLGARPFAAE